MYDIAIIGGGACGCACAIAATKRGKRVIIVEKESDILKKILVTGNGRCNITNSNISIKNYHSHNIEYILKFKELFDSKYTLDFFKKLSLEIYFNKTGRAYPLSNQASSVASLMKNELKMIDIILNSNIVDINFKKGLFYIDCLDRQIVSKKLLLSCGGCSHKKISKKSLDCYELAKKFSHKLIPTLPSLTPLLSNAPFLNKLQGVKVEANITLLCNKKIKKSILGDILFTKYGLSGSAILDISRFAVQSIANREDVKIKIDLFSKFKYNELYDLFKNSIKISSNKKITIWLKGFVNSKLINILLKEAKIDDIYIKNIKDSQIKKLTKVVKNFIINIQGYKDFKYSEVTQGGVDIKEIDIKTFESKKQKGLYFCGEILDVDGDCGGYNLQFAWQSGIKVASSI